MLTASAEVRRPLVYATLIALLAIVPVLVIGGRPGAFFGPLVTAYVVAVLAATGRRPHGDAGADLVADRRGGSRPAAAPHGRGPLDRAHAASLAQPRGRPRPSLVAVAVVAALVGIAALPFLDVSLRTRRSRTTTCWSSSSGEPGTSNERMTATATELRGGCSTCRVWTVSARTSDGPSPATGHEREHRRRLGAASTADADYDDDRGGDRAAVGGVTGRRARRRRPTPTQRIRDIGALDQR